MSRLKAPKSSADEHLTFDLSQESLIQKVYLHFGWANADSRGAPQNFQVQIPKMNEKIVTDKDDVKKMIKKNGILNVGEF